MAYTRLNPKFHTTTISGTTDNGNINSNISATSYTVVAAWLASDHWGQVIPWVAPSDHTWRFRTLSNTGLAWIADNTNVTIKVVYV